MTTDSVDANRRRLLIATSAVGAVGAVGIAVPFVASWNPSARAKAAGAPVKFNISKIEPGAMVTVEWRGKPVYIVRRTEEALASLEQTKDRITDADSERSKQPTYAQNTHRSIKPEYLILVGICTHLGCAPKFRPEVAAADISADWVGGFFCPCHGSKFDLAGRVFAGVPAPLNLEVPPHYYVTDQVVIIGEDEGAA